jgi:hypothetical protein
MKYTSTISWLLEENQPSIRFLTLTELLGKSENDTDVKSARKAITEQGWAQEILAKQMPGGWWGEEASLYQPKYTSTNWMLLILSDLGLTRKEPRIAKACELWMQRFAKEDGGFNTDGARRGHLCIVGNTASALIQFGYADDPKVQRALGWLVG